MTEKLPTQSRFSVRKSIQYLKAHKKEMFWVWITYQCIKGMLTLTMIWIPLWLFWRSNS